MLGGAASSVVDLGACARHKTSNAARNYEAATASNTSLHLWCPCYHRVYLAYENFAWLKNYLLVKNLCAVWLLTRERAIAGSLHSILRLV
jgi:hypothetical protein